MDIRPDEFLICFISGITDNCFDEDRYNYDEFQYAWNYYNDYNTGYEKGDDYVELWAVIKDIGLVKISGLDNWNN